MRRQRGFTLAEILIALALSSLMSAFLLMLTRGQLTAYQMNDSIIRAQQNARAGMEFFEVNLRKACGGLGVGDVGINTPLVSPSVKPCVKVWDGAPTSAGTFSAGSATPDSAPDAIEIIYGSAPYTQATAPLVTTTPQSVAVADTTGFAVDDFVLITDFSRGVLFQVASISGTTNGTLTFKAPGGTYQAPVAAGGVAAFTPAAGNGVLKAQSIALYVQKSANGLTDLLMFDPDGMAGNSHTDAQPVVEGVEDLQLAVGVDANADGIIADTGVDEWQGNAVGELATLAAPWNSTGLQQLRSIRVAMLVKTMNNYTSTANLGFTPPLEDRSSYPAVAAGAPRFRPTRMLVSPRAWNPLN